jgi:VWFA-related protein
MRSVIFAAVAAFALQQPTFRSGVDLLRMDVAVVDREGRPVRDLRLEDFVVTVDGAPRRVAFAQFYGPDDRPTGAGAAPAVSTATNLAAPKGRVLVLVIDIDSIIPGKEKLIFDTASRLVDRLGPADAVGLFVLPGKGVEITRHHDSVRKVLATLRGTASPPPHGYRMSVAEAEAFRYKEGLVIQEVMIRECRATDTSCKLELDQLARWLLAEADRRTQVILPSLTTLFSKLELIEAPRGVVLLSAGFQRNRASDAYIRDLEKHADTAGVRMSIVQIEQTQNDASFRLGAGGASRGDLAEGLGAIGGATEAEMYFGIGQAIGAFERIGNEIVYSYELGIESSASDGDGRKHRLRIDVKRPGVTVRARKEFVVSTKPRPASNPVEVLANPVDFAEAPMAVSTYTTRGDDASTLKVLVLVEGLTVPAAQGLQRYAVSVSDGQGMAAFETAGQFGEGQSATAIAAQLAPGRYRLRAALVDGAGRRGSLEMPILVGLRPAGGLQFSDLIIGAVGAPIPVTSRAAPGSSLATLLEMVSADPAQLEGLSVTIEARRAGDAGAPLSVAADVRTTTTDRRRFAVAEVPAGKLQPGTWVVSAVVRRGEAVVGQVSRTIVVEPPRADASGGHADFD